jgi:catechol 2,3-dioxygenase-like lactoylglutathione lyase family enzyme
MPPKLKFEAIIGYATTDAEEAAHFFEHTLGLELGAEDAGVRFYQLADGTTLTVDATGRAAGDPPYMLFSADNVVEAAEYFLERGCAVKELPWASGAGFIATAPEGHTVAVIATEALRDAVDS